MRNFLTLYFAVGLVETGEQLTEKHKDLLLLWAGPFPIVVLLNPEYVQVRQ
jgi:hypothetical protein